jgi:hypothetical protein
VHGQKIRQLSMKLIEVGVERGHLQEGTQINLEEEEKDEEGHLPRLMLHGYGDKPVIGHWIA